MRERQKDNIVIGGEEDDEVKQDENNSDYIELHEDEFEEEKETLLQQFLFK